MDGHQVHWKEDLNPNYHVRHFLHGHLHHPPHQWPHDHQHHHPHQWPYGHLHHPPHQCLIVTNIILLISGFTVTFTTLLLSGLMGEWEESRSQFVSFKRK